MAPKKSKINYDTVFAQAKAAADMLREVNDTVDNLEELADPQDIKNLQRELSLAARDAMAAACSLYTNLRISEAEQKLKKAGG